MWSKVDLKEHIEGGRVINAVALQLRGSVRVLLLPINLSRDFSILLSVNEGENILKGIDS